VKLCKINVFMNMIQSKLILFRDFVELVFHDIESCEACEDFVSSSSSDV